MLQVEFEPDRVILTKIRSNEETARVEASGLSNGELGCLLKVCSHPDGGGLLEGRIQSIEAGVSQEQLQLLMSKIRMSEFRTEGHLPAPEASRQNTVVSPGDKSARISPVTLTKGELGMAVSLLKQGKRLGRETLALLLELTLEAAGILIDEIGMQHGSVIVDGARYSTEFSGAEA